MVAETPVRQCTASARGTSGRGTWGLRLIAVAGLAVLWQVTATVMHNPAFIPPPSAVWHRLIETSTAHDGVRGYMGTLRWVRVVTEPVVTFVRALPPLASFSLFIIWFGIDETPKLWLL